MADDPSMIPPATTRPSRPRIGVVAVLRLFACRHLDVFHLMQAHHAGRLSFALFDGLPICPDWL